MVSATLNACAAPAIAAYRGVSPISSTGQPSSLAAASHSEVRFHTCSTTRRPDQPGRFADPTDSTSPAALRSLHALRTVSTSAVPGSTNRRNCPAASDGGR